MARTRKCKKHRFNIDKNIDAREIERKQATKVSNYFFRVDNCIDDYKHESRKGVENWVNRACHRWNCTYFRIIQQWYSKIIRDVYMCIYIYHGNSYYCYIFRWQRVIRSSFQLSLYIYRKNDFHVGNRMIISWIVMRRWVFLRIHVEKICRGKKNAMIL